MSRNDNLRMAMHARRISVVKLAQMVPVDAKTVERWLRGERVPHPPNRAKVADILGVDEEYLWPPQLEEAAATQHRETSDLITTYAHRGMVPSSLWTSMVRGAKERVDVFVFAGLFWLDAHPDMVDLLLERAAAGVKIRLAFGDPDSTAVGLRGAEEGIDMAGRVRMSLQLAERLVECPLIEVRLHATTLYSSIYRADGIMLENSHIYGCPASAAPVRHLQQLPGGKMFERYAQSFEKAWDTGRRITSGSTAWRAPTTTTTPPPPPPTASSPPPSAA